MRLLRWVLSLDEIMSVRPKMRSGIPAHFERTPSADTPSGAESSASETLFERRTNIFAGMQPTLRQVPRPADAAGLARLPGLEHPSRVAIEQRSR